MKKLEKKQTLPGTSHTTIVQTSPNTNAMPHKKVSLYAAVNKNAYMMR
jgi:hypothetical protein